MKIDRVKIKNFRGFRDVELELGGESKFIIAPNAGGKTSLLTAIARALGRDLAFTAADFADRTDEILIQATVSELSPAQRSALGNYVDFTPGRPQVVTLQVRSTWNESSEVADTEHGYSRPGSRSRRDERDAVSLQWLPTFREPARMLSFGNARNLLGLLLEITPVTEALESAIDGIQEASSTLTSDSVFQEFLSSTRGELSSFIPNVSDSAYSISAAALGRADLLAQFELLLAYLGEGISIARQSSGLGQLSIFSVLSILIQQNPGTMLLVDEPEISLHPQAQRALIHKFGHLDCQMLVATHSANMLDRIDPRQIVRLMREEGQLTFVSPSSVSDVDARYLSRFTTPFVAEAFFSQVVVLVEGVSDQLAVEAVAERLDRDFDAEGLSIVPMQGAGNIKAFAKLFGPMGLDLKMAGLCDAAEAPLFARGLNASGVSNVTLSDDLPRANFFVCNRDLEDELIRALGDTRTESVIEDHGDIAAFRTFQQQASQRHETLTDQLHRFISGRKVEYAIPMLDALSTEEIPEPLRALVSALP